MEEVELQPYVITVTEVLTTKFVVMAETQSDAVARYGLEAVQVSSVPALHLAAELIRVEDYDEAIARVTGAAE